MTELNDLLTGPLAERIGWSLLHFAWQGVLVAAALAMALRALRGASAAARYLACCGAMALFAALPLITFTILPFGERPGTAESHALLPGGAADVPRAPDARADGAGRVETPAPAPARAPGSDRGAAPQAPPASAGGPQATFARPPSRWRELEAGVRSAVPWLATCWAAGAMLLSFRLLAGAAWVGMLRGSAGAVVEADLERRLAALARKLRLRHTPRLLQSAKLEVPTVVGCLRPLILLPAGLVTGLTPYQIEAILAHELAHVRRHDYLVNWVQSLIETLLFYHPAVWWVSARMRAERENCCDDIAVAVCGDPVQYARTLSLLEDLRSVPVHAALAAGGGSLVLRVRRLLGSPQPQEGQRWWVMAAFALVASAAAAGTAGPAAPGERPASPPERRMERGRAAPPAERKPRERKSQPPETRARAGGHLPPATTNPARREDAKPATRPARGSPAAAQPHATRTSRPDRAVDEIASLTEEQKAGVKELRRRQQELESSLKAVRREMMAGLTEGQREQLQAVIGRHRRATSDRRPAEPKEDANGAPDGSVAAPPIGEVASLTGEQRERIAELYRRHQLIESEVKEARAEMASVLTAGQRRELQEKMAAGRRAAGRETSGIRGTVERVDGATVWLRPAGPTGSPGPLKVETGRETRVRIDGRPATVEDLRAGHRAMVENWGGVATRVEARSGTPQRPPDEVRGGTRPRQSGRSTPSGRAERGSPRGEALPAR